jgi:hypothetical protein
MAKFIEVRNIEGYKILINVDNIQSIRQVDGLGKTSILLNNDIVRTELEYSKVVELVSPKKKGFRLWQ